MTFSHGRKSRPLLIIGMSSANPQGSAECLKESCQMWCKEEFGSVPIRILQGTTIVTRGYRDKIVFQAGCGLMPKSNRKV